MTMGALCPNFSVMTPANVSLPVLIPRAVIRCGERLNVKNTL